jgi:hypothetical protein
MTRSRSQPRNACHDQSVFEKWVERRRRAAARRKAEAQTALIAKSENAERSARAAEARVREAALLRARKLETMRQAVRDDVERYMQKLPPLGTSVEAAIDALLVASSLNPGVADLRRPTFVALAAKFAQPDERLLGVYLKARLSANSTRVSYPVIAVAFTHGFGVKCGSQTFRTDLVSANPSHEVSVGDYPDNEPYLMIHASVRLGEEVCVEVDVKQGRVSDLYLMIAAQAKLSVQSTAPTTGVARKRARSQPKPVLIRTWRDAELVAAEWMKYWGYTNVAATAVGTDGGIDVVSNEAVAQVKAETSATGRPKVQQHHGVAVSEGKTALFFALAGFTPAARTYAEENAILLFTFDLQGEPKPVNTAAHALIANWSR